MSTAQQIINRSLRVLGVIGAGETATSDDSADALTVLNQMIQSLSLQGLATYRCPLETFNLVPNQTSYTVGPSGADLVTTRPLKILDGYIRLNNIDYPVQLVDAPTYDSYAKKNVTTNLPDRVFYDPTLTNGTFYFYPMPSQANAFYFRSWKVLESFASLSETVDLPQGYDRMLVYMLARELSPEYGKALTADIDRLYTESLANLKRMNHMAINGSTWEVSKPGGRYNIYSDGWR